MRTRRKDENNEEGWNKEKGREQGERMRTRRKDENKEKG